VQRSLHTLKPAILEYWRRLDHRTYKRLGISSNYSILGGPFKGNAFRIRPTWGNATLKLLGAYECCLHPLLGYLKTNYCFKQIAVLGSAEGYYAAGLSLLFGASRSFAFDIDSRSQAQTRELYQQNKIDGTVLGRATGSALNGCLCESDSTLLMIDIEGDEADLLVPHAVPILATAHIILEIHEFHKPDMLSLIKARFERTHAITVIEQKYTIDPYISALPTLNDIDKHLLCSEARPSRMRWLHLAPIAVHR